MKLKDHLEQAGRGAASRLAEAIESYQSDVSDWVKGFRPVPMNTCAAIERFTVGAVTVEELNPDLPWSRIPDKSWPHPKGRPVVDVSLAKEAA